MSTPFGQTCWCQPPNTSRRCLARQQLTTQRVGNTHWRQAPQGRQPLRQLARRREERHIPERRQRQRRRLATEARASDCLGLPDRRHGDQRREGRGAGGGGKSRAGDCGVRLQGICGSGQRRVIRQPTRGRAGADRQDCITQ